MEGDYVGKSVRGWSNCEDDKALGRVLQLLDQVGIEVQDEDSLQEALDALIAKRSIVVIGVSTRGDFQSAFINKLSTGEDDGIEETVPSGAAEEEPAAEEEATLEVGMKVSFEWKGQTLEGEVTAILEAEGKAKVKVGKLLYPVKVEDLSLVTEEEPAPEATEEEVPEEPAEEPVEEPAPVKKKPTVIKKTGKVIKKGRKK
jgi:hypothetical protein